MHTAVERKRGRSAERPVTPSRSMSETSAGTSAVQEDLQALDDVRRAFRSLVLRMIVTYHSHKGMGDVL